MLDQRSTARTRIRRPWPVLAVACALAITHLATVGAADAQQRRYQQWGGGDPAAETLVKELNRLIDRAEADRAADPLLFKDLRNAIRQYESEARQRPRRRSAAPPPEPVRMVRLEDDFSDGDFTRNPAWTARSGRFWVDRRRGLRSVVERPAPVMPAAAPQVSPTSIASPRFGSASGERTRAPVPRAFDANRGTYWESRAVGRAIEGRSFIGQDFGAGNAKHIGRIHITQRLDKNDGNAYSVDVERWAGGKWQTVGRFALSGGGERQALDVPRSGPSERWRVLARAVIVASRDARWRVAELEMEEIDQPRKLAAAARPAPPPPAPEPQPARGGLGGLLGGSDLGKTGGALVDRFLRKQFGQPAPPPPAKAPEPVKPKAIVVTSARAAALPRPKAVAPAKPRPAEISIAVEIGNAFTIRADIQVLADRGRVSFGPYQSAGRTDGYRLVLSPAGRPWLELRSLSARGGRAIASVDQPASDDDRRGGLVEWTRRADGVMTVRVGGRVALRAVDRGYRDPFRGLTIVNDGGDVLVSSIAVTETR